MDRTIFELVAKAHRFAKIELINAIIGVSVFGTIFLVFFPYGDKIHDDRPLAWMVGPPLVYFVMDLLAATLLILSLKNEMQPKKCYFWMMLQLINLFMLTVIGFYIAYAGSYQQWVFLKLGLALIVLCLYKGFRATIMLSLIQDMKKRCLQISLEAHQQQIPQVQKY